MKILHTGCFVENMDRAIKQYNLLGYESLGENVFNPSMNIIGHYMQNGSTVVELITPVDETSPISNMLKKLGPGPYHICYETLHLLEDIKRLRKDGYIVVNSGEKSDIEAHSFAFLYHANIGFIELIERD